MAVRTRLCARLTGMLTLSVTMLATPPFDTEFLSKIVVFLYASTNDGEANLSRPVGTAFLTRIPHQHDEGVTVLMVTARHIVDPEWARCPQQRNPEALYARINRVESNAPERVKMIKLVLTRDGHPTWFRHVRDDVDAAVVPISFTPSELAELDFRALPAWRLPTEEEIRQLSIGDDIVSAGMLLDLRTMSRNHPVFKFGKIANIPDEDLQTSCDGGPPFEVRGWLVGANLVPGNSGSPIFYFPPFGEDSDVVRPGLQRMVLLGVQSSSNIPSAVAYMTPANYVFDIINAMKIPDADLYRGRRNRK